MKTEWDYTILANAYLKRPDYSDAAIDAMLAVAGTKSNAKVCDVGAGVAHLTLMLANRDMNVTAVEPNDAMRANGIKRTKNQSNVVWCEGTGEATGQDSHVFDMITFGSSFNVCDRQQALKECARILKPSGWFACMWNHRYLDDPIQTRIENIIKDNVPGYVYGTRREDQTNEIEKSNLFGPVVQMSSRIIHQQSVDECVEAWLSHATLERQAGAAFNTVVMSIKDYLVSLNKSVISIPYVTNIWVAQLR